MVLEVDPLQFRVQNSNPRSKTSNDDDDDDDGGGGGDDDDENDYSLICHPLPFFSCRIAGVSL